MAIKNNLGIWGQSNDYLDTGFEKDNNTGALKGFEPGSLIYAQDVNTALRNASLMGYVIGEILERKSESGGPLEGSNFDINYTNNNNENEALIDNIEAAFTQIIEKTEVEKAILAETTYNCFIDSDKYSVPTPTQNKRLLKFVKGSNSDDYYLNYDNTILGNTNLPLWYSGEGGFATITVPGSSPTKPVYFNFMDAHNQGFFPMEIDGSNNKKPVYFDLTDGFKVMGENIGSITQPISFSSENGFTPIYIANSSNTKPVYFDINDGFKAMDKNIGSITKPIYFDTTGGFKPISLIDTDIVRIGIYDYDKGGDRGQLSCYLDSQIEFTSITVPTQSTPVYAYWKKAKEAFKLTTEDDSSGYSVGNIVTGGDDEFIKPIGFRKGIPIEAKQFYIDKDSWSSPIDTTPVSNPGAGNYPNSVSGHFTLPQNYTFLTKKFRLLLIIGSNSPSDMNGHIVASDIINLDWYDSTIGGYKIGSGGTCKVSFPIGADLNAYNASNDTFGLIAYLYFDDIFTSTYNTPLFIQLYTQRRVSSQSTVKEYYLNEEQAQLIKGLVIEYIN